MIWKAEKRCRKLNNSKKGVESGSGLEINEFRDFVANVIKSPRDFKITQSVLKAKSIVSTIAISSAEAERGFSKMNEICSPKRNKLKISNISDYMTISLIGLPLEDWNSKDIVLKWLSKNGSANNTEVKKRKIVQYSENEKKCWKYLNELED